MTDTTDTHDVTANPVAAYWQMRYDLVSREAARLRYLGRAVAVLVNHGRPDTGERDPFVDPYDERIPSLYSAAAQVGRDVRAGKVAEAEVLAADGLLQRLAAAAERAVVDEQADVKPGEIDRVIRQAYTAGVDGGYEPF